MIITFEPTNPMYYVYMFLTGEVGLKE